MLCFTLKFLNNWAIALGSMRVSCNAECSSVWASPEHLYNDWRASLLADAWEENQIQKVKAGRNSVLESIQLVYKDLPNMYLTYVCSLNDHRYYQASGDEEGVKDCEEKIFSHLQLLFLYSKANARSNSQQYLIDYLTNYSRYLEGVY